MSAIQEAPAAGPTPEEPTAATAAVASADTPVVAAEPWRPRGLALTGIIIGAVVVAAALFGSGVVVGLAIPGGTGTTQNQFGGGGQGGFPGGGQGGQGGFPGGQNGTGTQGGTQQGPGQMGGQQGTQQGGTQQGSTQQGSTQDGSGSTT